MRIRRFWRQIQPRAALSPETQESERIMDVCEVTWELVRLKMSLNFDAFCDHAAHGRLADVQRMLESNELKLPRYADQNDAVVRAAQNGHADVVEYLLRNAMFDPSANGNRAILWAAQNGHLAVVKRLLRDERVDPSAQKNITIQSAAYYGHVAVVDLLLQDVRVEPSAENNCAVQWAAEQGHLAVVERLLREMRVDPSADNNSAIQRAAGHGHLAVVERLLQDPRVDPSAVDNRAVRAAARDGHLAVRFSRPEHLKRFECRERLTEICIALQDLALPAWVTVQILDAARPWSTLPLHSKWNLVCAVKHFR
jgi:ankyrin repeat protein